VLYCRASSFVILKAMKKRAPKGIIKQDAPTTLRIAYHRE
jgi:hypothetical protein